MFTFVRPSITIYSVRLRPAERWLDNNASCIDDNIIDHSTITNNIATDDDDDDDDETICIWCTISMKVASECIRSRWVDVFYMFAASGDGRRCMWRNIIRPRCIGGASRTMCCAIRNEVFFDLDTFIIYNFLLKVYMRWHCAPSAPFVVSASILNTSSIIISRDLSTHTNTNYPINSFVMYNKHKQSHAQTHISSWKIDYE